MNQFNNIIEEFKKTIKSIQYLHAATNRAVFTEDDLEKLQEAMDDLQAIDYSKLVIPSEIYTKKEKAIEFSFQLQSKLNGITDPLLLAYELLQKLIDSFIPIEMFVTEKKFLQEIICKKIETKEIRLLSTFKQQIIIKEHYFGLTIFDRNLEKIKNVLVKEDFWVHQLYKRFSHENELLIFNDEERIFVYINITNDTHFTISLSTISDDIYFSRYYHWIGDTFTVLSNKGDAFQLNLQTKKITEVSIDSVKGYFSFLKELNYVPSDREFYPINMEKSQYIFKDWDNGRYEFIDYKKNERFFIEFFDDESYQYLYENDLLVIICESQIIIFKDQKQVAMLKTNIPHTISGAEFLDGGSKLVVLITNRNSHVQRMYVYEISIR